MNTPSNKVMDKVDPKYAGIPNINFSLTDKDDKRENKYSKQRIERGFDDSELWSLDCTIANFILPRLIEFRKQINGYPGHLSNEGEWVDMLDKMIEAFELVTQSKLINHNESSIEYQKFNEGITLFKDNFLNLWN